MEQEAKLLRNYRSLRRVLSNFSIAEIDSIISKLQAIKEEHVIEIQNKAKENLVDDQKIANALEAVKKSDLSAAEMEKFLKKLGVKNAKRSGTKKGPLKAKYSYKDVNGIEHSWSGRGVTPKTLRELMQRDGTTKEDYRIKE